MPLSTKRPVKVAVIEDATASAVAARPTHGIVSLRAAMARMALAATHGKAASVALRAAAPRFDLNGVRAQTVTTIIMSPSTASVAVSGAAQTTELSAQAFDQSGQPMSATFVWESDNNAIATVDQTGLVTGVAFGTCTITASVGAVQATCTLTVGYDPRPLIASGFWYHPAAADVVKDGTTAKTSRLIDLSGLGNDATQFTAASELTWEAAALNGGPSIRGAAGTKMTAPVVDMHAGFLFATVLSPSDLGGDRGLGSIADGTSGSRLGIWLSATGQIAVRIYQTYNTTFLGRATLAGAVALGMRAVITVAWDGTFTSAGIRIFVNGVRKDDHDSASGVVTAISAPTIPFTVASSAGTNNGNFIGDLGDYLFCTQPQTDTDRQTLEQAFMGNTPLYVPPAPPAKFSGDLYVSATGSANAQATLADPIDAQTLSNAGAQAGSRVWMRGVDGTYTGDLAFHFIGTPANRITVRNYNNERVTLDGHITTPGSYTDYWGLEVLYSEPTRVSTQTTGDLSTPSDIPRVGHGFGGNTSGPGNRYINCIVHDLSNGMGDNDTVVGTETYGCIIHSNGWQGTDRGHGHGLYIQNGDPTGKVVKHNVVFNNFDVNVQLGGTSDAKIQHLTYTENIVFGAGAPVASVFGYTFNVALYGGGVNLGDIACDGNVAWHKDGTTTSLQLGLSDGTPSFGLTWTNSLVQGNNEINEWPRLTFTGNRLSGGPTALPSGSRLALVRVPTGKTTADYTVDTNTYADVPNGENVWNVVVNGVNQGASTLAAWQSLTGWDASSTFQTTQFSTATVKVYPNEFEAGMGYVACDNPAGLASLTVDLSAVLAVGDVYSVWHVYDVFGTPVIASATYDGNPVTLGQTGYVAPTPIGYGSTPASTAPYFNAFLVRKVA